MRVRSRRILVQGYRCHFTEAGEGAPLVLLASMFVRTRSYTPTMRSLAERFHVVTVNLPGSGYSSMLRHPWSFEHYADWTRALLEALALPPVTLVGHSNSGPVALMTPTGVDGRVARVVLADTVGAHPFPSLGTILLGRTIDAFYEPLLSLGGWPDIAYNVWHHTRTCLRQLLLCRDDVLDEARSVSVPTLIAWGRNDHTMPLGGAVAFTNAVRNSESYISPSGSHDWLITHPDEFATVVERFVGATPRKRGVAPTHPPKVR